MAAHDDHDMLQSLEARLAKATWTSRLLAVWCLLLTWHALDVSSFRHFVGHRNQPLLGGAALVLVALAFLWGHGTLWARPRDDIRLRVKK